MLVTNLAYRDMEARSDSVVDRLGKVARRLLRRPAATNAATPTAGQPGAWRPAPLRLVALNDEIHHYAAENDSGAPDPFRWRRHPQLLNRAEPLSPPDAVDLERSGRSAAVRGLFLARSGRFEGARTAFAISASVPSVDLTAIPGFWDLSRAGMLAAVGAYEDTFRFRDASALGARIRLTYRPRSVSVVPNTPAASERTAAGS